MRWAFLAFLIVSPAALQASCTDNDDPLYNQAVAEGNYDGAFALIAEDLHIPFDDREHFKVIPGFSRKHDDRHGQSDPVKMEVHLDPALFIEGKDGACQGVAHEWTHLRQFRRDRKELHAFFSSRAVPESGWKGCDRDELEDLTPGKAENVAYECLQDNALGAHASAMDIEAILAQIPYAPQKVLRDEDLSYLVENLTHWSDYQNEITMHDNESYYLPGIKSADVQLFCRGTAEARARMANTTTSRYAWDAFCGVTP